MLRQRRLPRISTGNGDNGYTYDPITKSRVPKWHACIEFVGSLDEAEAFVARARVLVADAGMDEYAEMLKRVEELLFRIGFTVSGRECIGAGDVAWVEEAEDKLMERVGVLLDGFRLNGVSPEATAIAVARVSIRRAERSFWKCVSYKPDICPRVEWIGKFLNRVSDLLFLLQLEVDRIRGYKPPRITCRD